MTGQGDVQATYNFTTHGIVWIPGAVWIAPRKSAVRST